MSCFASDSASVEPEGPAPQMITGRVSLSISGSLPEKEVLQQRSNALVFGLADEGTCAINAVAFAMLQQFERRIELRRKAESSVPANTRAGQSRFVIAAAMS